MAFPVFAIVSGIIAVSLGVISYNLRWTVENVAEVSGEVPFQMVIFAGAALLGVMAYVKFTKG